MKYNTIEKNAIWTRYESLCIRHISRPFIRVVKEMQKPENQNVNPFVNNRRRPGIGIRQLLSYTLYNYTGLSLAQIGYAISPPEKITDHATVLNHIRRIIELTSWVGFNGNSRPVCGETYKLVRKIEIELEKQGFERVDRSVEKEKEINAASIAAR